MNLKELDTFREFVFNAPESMDGVQKYEVYSKIKLPSQYVEFLLQADGGEGFIGPDNYLILWRLSELIELNAGYEVSKYAPGFLLIGSDGGGEAIAIDMRMGGHSICRLPFVGMDVKLSKILAPDFKFFLIKVAQEDMYE